MILSKGDTRFVFFANDHLMISNLIHPQVSKKMNEDHFELSRLLSTVLPLLDIGCLHGIGKSQDNED